MDSIDSVRQEPTTDTGAGTIALAQPPSVNSQVRVIPAACPSCASSGTDAESAPAAYVYALGNVEPRFPNLSVEKEFAQAVGRTGTADLSDREAAHAALVLPENRYLLKQLCWVFRVEGIDAYILQPRDGVDFELLLATLRPTPKAESDIDVIIGIRGPIAPPELCNGLMLPIVFVDNSYSFDVPSLLKELPRPEKTKADRFQAASRDLFHRVVQIADNTGATDEHRALNYLAVRYSDIYTMTANQFARNASLTSVETYPSRLSGPRKILQVVFTFTQRDNFNVTKFFVRVDVSEEFPFLLTPLQEYFER